MCSICKQRWVGLSLLPFFRKENCGSVREGDLLTVPLQSGLKATFSNLLASSLAWRSHNTLGRAGLTPHALWGSQPPRKEKGIPQGREKQEGKLARRGGKCGTQMENREKREGPLSLLACQAAESWYVLCLNPQSLHLSPPHPTWAPCSVLCDLRLAT